MYLSHFDIGIALVVAGWLIALAYTYGREREQRLSSALFNLGLARLSVPVGASEDEEPWIDCFQRAAELGHARAAFVLGERYYHGIYWELEVYKDNAEAYIWFDHAAANQKCASWGTPGRLSWYENRLLRKYLAETRQAFEKRNVDRTHRHPNG